MDSSSVMCPEKPGSTNPAVEWVSSPSRPSEDLPSSRAARSSGRVIDLERGAEHELAGVQHERVVAVGLDQRREVVLLLGRVDVGVPGVVEDPEEAVEPDVDARGLHQPGVVGLDAEASLGDRGRDVAVAQQHGAESRERPGSARGTLRDNYPTGALIPVSSGCHVRPAAWAGDPDRPRTTHAHVAAPDLAARPPPPARRGSRRRVGRRAGPGRRAGGALRPHGPPCSPAARRRCSTRPRSPGPTDGAPANPWPPPPAPGSPPAPPCSRAGPTGSASWSASGAGRSTRRCPRWPGPAGRPPPAPGSRARAQPTGRSGCGCARTGPGAVPWSRRRRARGRCSSRWSAPPPPPGWSSGTPSSTARCPCPRCSPPPTTASSCCRASPAPRCVRSSPATAGVCPTRPTSTPSWTRSRRPRRG